MGERDILEKKYLQNSKRFADAFNYYIYKGKQVINPDDLKEIGTEELAVPYGNNAKEPVQRIRDVAKTWEILHAMADYKAIYVILAAETQDRVHYAAPVKDGLCDFLNYAKQVTEAKKSYKKFSDTGDDKIYISSAEYLSGFRKDDHLVPVVTLMIYFGSEEWDGPMSIHDMFEPEIRKDELLMNVIPDYKLNLLTPNDIPDEDFDSFKSELGAAMYFLKKQNEGKMSDWIYDFNKRFGVVERDTAELITELSRTKLPINKVVEENGGVDMCKAFERSMEDAIETGRIEGRTEGRTEGKAEGQQETLVSSIRNLMKSLQCTVDKAMELLMVPQEQRTKYAELINS